MGCINEMFQTVPLLALILCCSSLLLFMGGHVPILRDIVSVLEGQPHISKSRYLRCLDRESTLLQFTPGRLAEQQKVADYTLK